MTSIWESGRYSLHIADNKLCIYYASTKILEYNDNLKKWFGRHPITKTLIIIDWPTFRDIINIYEEKLMQNGK